jgi:hypothetical protein
VTISLLNTLLPREIIIITVVSITLLVVASLIFSQCNSDKLCDNQDVKPKESIQVISGHRQTRWQFIPDVTDTKKSNKMPSSRINSS